MAIEQNIEEISSKLDTAIAWQNGHQVEDRKNFGEIRDILSNVADKKLIEDTVKAAVVVTVNGKLEDIKRHLNTQDTNLASLKKQLLPFNQTREWLIGLGKTLMYVGIASASITAIIIMLKNIHLI